MAAVWRGGRGGVYSRYCLLCQHVLCLHNSTAHQKVLYFGTSEMTSSLSLTWDYLDTPNPSFRRDAKRAKRDFGVLFVKGYKHICILYRRYDSCKKVRVVQLIAQTRQIMRFSDREYQDKSYDEKTCDDNMWYNDQTFNVTKCIWAKNLKRHTVRYMRQNV